MDKIEWKEGLGSLERGGQEEREGCSGRRETREEKTWEMPLKRCEAIHCTRKLLRQRFRKPEKPTQS